MYFHFPSKQALASAIIDDLNEMSRAAVTELLARKMSGLESLIDLVYLRAVQDTQNEVARAGVRLLETLDNTTALPTTLWQSWIELVTHPHPKSSHRGRRRRPPRSRRHRQTAAGNDHIKRLTRSLERLLPAIVADTSLAYFGEFLARESLRRPPGHPFP